MAAVMGARMALRNFELLKNCSQAKYFNLNSDFQLKGYFFLGVRWFASFHSAKDFVPKDSLTNITCLSNREESEHSSMYDLEKKEKIELKDQKILRVAIIGEPNSGKSTLVNSLVGEKLFAVTNKPHTTRQRAHGLFTRGSAQIVLLDTPGIVTRSEGRRLKMTREHITAPENALQEADMIAVVSDASDKRTKYRIHEQVIEALSNHKDIPSILILNKIDRLRHKAELLGLSAVLSEDREKDTWGYVAEGGWSKFINIFMISARLGDGIDDIKEYLSLKAKGGEWMFPPGYNTNLTLEQRITEIFREKLLQLYEHEIPWQVKQVNILCDLRNDNQLRVHQKLYCRKKSQKRCVLEKLETLKEEVENELENTFNCEIVLGIEVGVSEKLGFQTPLPTY